jgi:hypothetical protein
MDKREVAAKLREQLPPRTLAVASPEGRDANDLLRVGKLGAFLTAVRVRACGNDTHAREGLLWDLVDMARLPMGIDAGTAAAAVKLAGELGKTVRLEACPRAVRGGRREHGTFPARSRLQCTWCAQGQ